MQSKRCVGWTLLFIIPILIGCEKEHVNPKNFASALKDGQQWIADPTAEYRLHFGDSSMIISLQVPSVDGISKEAIVFYYVPLLTKEFSVIDTTLRDSVSIRASYLLFNSHGDLIIDRLHPSYSAENKLIIESFDKVTKELVLSFNVLFETRYPQPNYPSWNTSFTEGKIHTIVK